MRPRQTGQGNTLCPKLFTDPAIDLPPEPIEGISRVNRGEVLAEKAHVGQQIVLGLVHDQKQNSLIGDRHAWWAR